MMMVAVNGMIDVTKSFGAFFIGELKLYCCMIDADLF